MRQILKEDKPDIWKWKLKSSSLFTMYLHVKVYLLAFSNVLSFRYICILSSIFLYFNLILKMKTWDYDMLFLAFWLKGIFFSSKLLNGNSFFEKYTKGVNCKIHHDFTPKSHKSPLATTFKWSAKNNLKKNAKVGKYFTTFGCEVYFFF